LIPYSRNEGPPNSGYSLFSEKLLSSNSLKQFETSEERTAEISRLWKELSDEEKASYKDEAAQVTFIKESE
jgi:upstream-binding transcription factor